MSESIALVGMACRYPDADNPLRLWENVLAKRRAFRRLPPERLNLADYFSEDITTPDAIYSQQAAVIEGYEFDRVKYRIVKKTYRSTDLTHWLALDVASQALEDAGFPEGKGLSKARTGVLVGNTLTGEFSRAALMRLRWPFVRRIVDAELRQLGWLAQRRKAFLFDLETHYKQPFEPVGEETLAGGLSNTIAGRICNYFDFKGGGYTLDGACSASLVAIANACTALLVRDVDTVVVGGVDLSLDPFELIGFSKTGALAHSNMRVYDAAPNGFWPGEGCGFVVLMRYDDALACGARCYAIIRGWGISSDGRGGITRPEVTGQSLALERAYERAGYGSHTVPLFEGHGTGTPVGDEVELRTLLTARQHPKSIPAVIGSIKANIGHTKAAAGVAGLLKAVMAVHHQILPPATGVTHPHPLLAGQSADLRLLSQGEIWPTEYPLRAGVSSFGFGGINVHLTIEGVSAMRRAKLMPKESALFSSEQEAELFLFSAKDIPAFHTLLRQVIDIAPRLSLSELTDLAAMLARQVDEHALVKAAVVATTPNQLAEKLSYLLTQIDDNHTQRLEIEEHIFFKTDCSTAKPQITLLLPGQASPVRLNGGLWARRFPQIKALYERARLPKASATTDLDSTAIAQPAIIMAELTGLQILADLGIPGELALGHSLGELAALYWAGAIDEATLRNLVQIRGTAMNEISSSSSTMLSLGIDGEKAEKLCANQDNVNIACFNSPKQTVISGTTDAIEKLKQSAENQGITATHLPVSHGFHSKWMSPAADLFATHLAQINYQPLQRRVLSTITGTELAPESNLKSLLAQQITTPVQFTAALDLALQETDLFIETGPGQVLTELVRQKTTVPVIPLDTAGPSLEGLLSTIGAAYVLGAPINRQALFADRLIRPFSLDWQPQFFVNPCELAPQLEESTVLETSQLKKAQVLENTDVSEKTEEKSAPLESEEINVLEQLRLGVAKSADLPITAIENNNRLLSDLHLNSITIGQIVNEVGRKIGLNSPFDSTAYATSTVEEIAIAMQERLSTGEADSEALPRVPTGIDAWVRPFQIEWVKKALDAEPLIPKGQGGWQVFASSQEPLKALLEERLNQWGGSGIALCLPESLNETHISLILAAGKAVLENKRHYFILVQHNETSIASFARTLYREHPDIITCVVSFSSENRIEQILAEVQIAQDYHEVYYDSKGNRHQRRLKPLIPSENSATPPLLTSKDILLVSGGGKGITAECATALAQETGVRLVLLGRSNPEKDTELSENLARLQKMGLQFKYMQTDVTDAQAVKTTVDQIIKKWGNITAILHGAGANQPTLLTHLEDKTFQATLAPKVNGLRHLLNAIEAKHLRLLVSFGSIIATTGMPGEADYAVANEWLAAMTTAYQKAHPSIRCLTLEWSVWSEIGMGRRLGSDDRLAQQGICPISPDMGVAILRQVLKEKQWPTTIVVTGRMPDVPTLPIERPEMPFYRFLENPRVYYPGIELIIECELSLISDPHLNDHIYSGERLFAAVMGLEAIAQVASAVRGLKQVPIFEAVKFSHPIIVKETQSETLQIAALVQNDGTVDVALRCAQTGFKQNHFQARCRFNPLMAHQQGQHNIQNIDLKEKKTSEKQNIEMTAHNIDLNAQETLYGGLLFQTGRFKRLHHYQHIEATQCIAEIGTEPPPLWFGRYFSPELILGDPGTRDATIHAIQACIPHFQLLPIGIERLEVIDALIPGPWTVSAKERWHKDELFCYDITVHGQNGKLRETWTGLHLRQVSPINWENGWIVPLLAPYLERQIQALQPDISVRVAIEEEITAQRRTRTEKAFKQGLGIETEIVWRSDGKPEAPESGLNISAAHAGNLTLAVSGKRSIACDLEAVLKREEEIWRDLLGIHQEWIEDIKKAMNEDNNQAATRIWTARECLKKVGALLETPLTLKYQDTEGWLVLGAGEKTIVSTVVSLKTSEAPLAIAILV
jgi:enediyne polyketide synthase